MHDTDQEKTAFITDRGLYCYKVMPFGLKNAGATYQRLVNMMFKDQIERNMEVYVDDMLVKRILPENSAMWLLDFALFTNISSTYTSIFLSKPGGSTE
jgi:hypothetical protein